MVESKVWKQSGKVHLLSSGHVCDKLGDSSLQQVCFPHMVAFYLTMCFQCGKGEFYCLSAPCCTLLYACHSYPLQSCREDLLADQLHHKCLSWRIHSYRVSNGLGFSCFLISMLVCVEVWFVCEEVTVANQTVNLTGKDDAVAVCVRKADCPHWNCAAVSFPDSLPL